MLTAEQRERMLRNKQAAQERLESSRKKQCTGNAFIPTGNPYFSVSSSEKTGPNARGPITGNISSESAGADLPNSSSIRTFPNLSELGQSHMAKQAAPPLWVKEGARSVLGLLNGNAVSSRPAVGQSPQSIKPINPNDRAANDRTPWQLPSLPLVSTSSSQREVSQQSQGASGSGVFLAASLQACSKLPPTNQGLPPGTIQSKSTGTHAPDLRNPTALKPQVQSPAQFEDSPEFDDNWLQEIDSLCQQTPQRTVALPGAESVKSCAREETGEHATPQQRRGGFGERGVISWDCEAGPAEVTPKGAIRAGTRQLRQESIQFQIRKYPSPSASSSKPRRGLQGGPSCQSLPADSPQDQRPDPLANPPLNPVANSPQSPLQTQLCSPTAIQVRHSFPGSKGGTPAQNPQTFATTLTVPAPPPLPPPRETSADSDGQPLGSESELPSPPQPPASLLAHLDPPIGEDDGMPGYLRKLNPSQREAVLMGADRPLLVLAGPGSGKTSTMVARLLYLLSQGVKASQVLALTFTIAAASEMRERVAREVGKTTAKELTITTFHSFCLQLCRTHAKKLGRTPQFLVYGPSQQRRAVVEALRLIAGERGGENAGLMDPRQAKMQAKKWEKFIAQAKADGKTPDFYARSGNTEGAAVLGHYEETLRRCDALDYSDFISCVVRLLETDSEVSSTCEATWTHVLVDEFQDTSAQQYRFLRALAPHKRITVVGDDDQSIFSFNGANAGGFGAFRADFVGHKEVRLQQNYRSTGVIVAAAAALIARNRARCVDKRAFTDNAAGDRIAVVECRTEPAQCAFVVDSILMAITGNGSGNGEGPKWGDFAVLYRRQVTGKAFQEAFRARKIPFNCHGVAFYRKKVIRNVLAMLRLMVDPSDPAAGRRAFKALFGEEKEERKKAVDYVEKMSRSNKEGFLATCRGVFAAKVSGTLCRKTLAKGKKAVAAIDTLIKLASRETSLSALVTSVVQCLPARPAFAARAAVDESGGKYLNEDDDPRTLLTVLMDDVDDFLRNHYCPADVAPPEPIIPDARETGGRSHQPNLPPVERNHSLPAHSSEIVFPCDTTSAQRRSVDGNPEPFAYLDPNQPQGTRAETSVADIDLEHQEENHRGWLLSEPRSHNDSNQPQTDSNQTRNDSNQTRTTANQTHNEATGLGFMRPVVSPGRGCVGLVKVFLDHVNVREGQNFKTRREENQDSVTLTTMHQSKGLEWDTVFVIKVNDNETPLLHEDVHGRVEEGAASLEEERRLFYVAMTRARKRLFLTYVVTDSQRQQLSPSRFLCELPHNLLSWQGGNGAPANLPSAPEMACQWGNGGRANFPPAQEMDCQRGGPGEIRYTVNGEGGGIGPAPNGAGGAAEQSAGGMRFLQRFPVESRGVIATLLHKWAKAAAFQEPTRLLKKIGFVVDENLRSKKCKSKDTMRALKSALEEADAVAYAQHVIHFEQLPLEERALLQAERQEHFQQQCSDRAMATASVTAKQMAYLRSLGCTANPTNRLEASKLIEHYKSI
ncbi:ATP-dependent DNA helicase [Klebsormidium nitens]|uniref:DNA 3'-5' helicase n=1 Tax=Klebsormidium nitens TaxID=105231 RepID=A0A1Y1HZ58_KLENI|nr:ATP-dependent DNA helicase [Klebsormidium nitens]|eukprot:GAQ83934.1 ATP-dependent DNA helicase [Klebsormidium nitens]